MADPPPGNFYFTNMNGVTINPGGSGGLTLNDATSFNMMIAGVSSQCPLLDNSSVGDSLGEPKFENLSNDCWLQLSEPLPPMDSAFPDVIFNGAQEQEELWDNPPEQKMMPSLPIFFPPEQATDLSHQDYPGPYNFEVVIHPPGIKSPWEYSQHINKIYTDVSRNFPLSFRLEMRPIYKELFIRATPVFEEAQHSQEFVYRCISHLHADDPTNVGVDANTIQHVMRCQNEKTRYHGNRFKRLNCIFPLAVPGEGTTDVDELFQFVCKNSCASPSGMNRRPIQVIFTLEDLEGKVWGRRIVKFRICSVPKRDRKKDESDRERAANPRARAANPPARAANRNPPARAVNSPLPRPTNPSGPSKKRKVDHSTPSSGKSKPYLALSYHKANGEVDSLDIRLFGSVVTEVLTDVKKRVTDGLLEGPAHTWSTREKLEEMLNWINSGED